MNNHYSDVLLIWDFFVTYRDLFSINTLFSPEQLYQALQADEPPHFLQVLVVDLFYTMLEQPTFQSYSQFFNLINLISSKALKKAVLAQTWQACIKQLPKVPKIKQETQNQEFEGIVSILNQQSFGNLNITQKIKIFHLLIELLGYEQEHFQKEVAIREQMKEEVNLKFSLGREQEKIIRQQNKVQQLIDEEKRKRRKDKKRLDELINESQDFSDRIFYFQRLQSVRDKDGGSQFLLTCVNKIGQDGDSEYYVLFSQHDKLYVRSINSDSWIFYQGEEMKYVVAKLLQDKRFSQKIKSLIKKGYLNIGEEQNLVIANTTDQFDELMNIQFNLEFIAKCVNEEDLMLRTKQILLSLENDYSEYELNYWKCCWASNERRELWRNKIMLCDNHDELLMIIKKIPHQLSFANRKHGLSPEQLDENVKFKSFRLYWFYQNRQYCQAYTTLAKIEGDLNISYILVISLYEKLKLFMHKKIEQLKNNPIEMEMVVSESTIQSSLHEQVPSPPVKRLRNRKVKVNYREIDYEQKEQTESTQKKFPRPVCEVYGLRPRKQLKY